LFYFKVKIEGLKSREPNHAFLRQFVGSLLAAWRLNIDVPHPNDVVSVACVEVGPVRAPAQRNAVLVATLAGRVDGNLEGVDELFCLQIPHLYGGAGGSAQPVAVGRENECVDDVLGLQRVETLAFVQVP